ncbi:MAG: glycosyltransferase family 4 protein [bacterium]
MKILIFQRFDLASVSCARRVVCQAEELLRRGHTVWLTDYPHPGRREAIPELVNLANLGATLIPLERRITGFPRNLRILQRLRPRPDLIHLWKSYPDASLPALLLSRRWKIPLHYDWDDWEWGIAEELTGSRMAGWIAGRWDRLLPKLGGTLTAASQFLHAKALEWGTPENRIWDAPVGADVERFFPRERDKSLFEALALRDPVLVYHGQLEVASYAEQAVEALKEIRREIQTAMLLVVGGGRKMETIHRRAEELRVAKHVVCTGYVPADEIPRYLSLASAALAPFEKNDVTRAKSPLKIAEYLAMGLPVVASDVGDTRRMILGAGVCVPCRNIQEMARQAVWILKHPGVRQSMALAGRRLAETQYNWKRHVDALEAAYQTVLEKHADA